MTEKTEKNENLTEKHEKYDHCKCIDMTFEQIKDFAKNANTTSIKRLKRELEMDKYCSACTPYLKVMFKTGQTEFEDEVTAADV